VTRIPIALVHSSPTFWRQLVGRLHPLPPKRCREAKHFSPDDSEKHPAFQPSNLLSNLWPLFLPIVSPASPMVSCIYAGCLTRPIPWVALLGHYKVLSASWCTPTIYAPERTSTRRVSTSNVPLSSLHQNHGVLPWGWHLIPLPPSYIVPKGVSSSSEPPRFVVVNSIRPCPTGRKSRHHRSVLLEASSYLPCPANTSTAHCHRGRSSHEPRDCGAIPASEAPRIPSI
jgi:hypothetical protein